MAGPVTNAITASSTAVVGVHGLWQERSPGDRSTCSVGRRLSNLIGAIRWLNAFVSDPIDAAVRRATFAQCGPTATVLITGVGSLVGAGILDALAGRRQNLHIVGTSFGAQAPAVFRCDEAYLTPPSDDPAFGGRIAEVIGLVRPDVVIPGRDPDIDILAALDLAPERVMVGTAAAAELCADKLLLSRFAVEHDLPAVPTRSAAEGPIAIPAIAKPRRGSGSLGVRVVVTERQMAASLGDPGIVLQPLLGPLPELPDPTAGWPLFYCPPTARLGGVQGIIGPKGDLLAAAAFETHQVIGRVEGQWLTDDPDLAEVGRLWLDGMAEAGWRGPLNVATIHDGARWLGLELNGRFTGGTTSRLACGFDEVGIALNHWLGREVVPPMERLDNDVRAVMQPVARAVSSAASGRFARDGRWLAADGHAAAGGWTSQFTGRPAQGA